MDSRLWRKAVGAKLVASDAKSDVVLLKLDRKIKSDYFRIGDDIKVGEEVLLMGYPEVTQVDDEKIKYIHIFGGYIASYQPESSDFLDS